MVPIYIATHDFCWVNELGLRTLNEPYKDNGTHVVGTFKTNEASKWLQGFMVTNIDNFYTKFVWVKIQSIKSLPSWVDPLKLGIHYQRICFSPIIWSQVF